ncbi:hypothetical protein D3C77_548340 [compost metagenome]
MEYARIQLLALEMDLLKKLKELGGDVNEFMNTMQQSLGNLTEMNCYSAFRNYASVLCKHGSKVIREQRKRSECNNLSSYSVRQSGIQTEASTSRACSTISYEFKLFGAGIQAADGKDIPRIFK